MVNYDAMLGTKVDQIQFFLWVQTEGQEREKKGRKRQKGRERLREIKVEKTLGKIKGSREV